MLAAFLRTTSAAVGLFCFALPSVAAANDAPAPATPPSTFEVADVHISPHANNAFLRGGNLVGGRYVFHQATLVDLISNAWNLNSDFILGGPAWLDTDRFDITAQVPPGTKSDDARLMLRALLAERFALKVHNDTRPLPAFALSAPKGAGKLKPTEGGDSSCQFKPPADQTGPLLFIEFECHNRTMEQLVSDLHDWAGGYLNHPPVDRTKLNGAYDFNLRWTPKGQLGRAGADGIALPDAVDKQLGLHLDPVVSPLPVLVVDSASNKPTPNVADLDKRMPPTPPAEFEVAIIKPSKDDERLSLNINGSQITVTGAPLQFMIAWAWNLSPNDKDAVANAPKGLNDAKYDIVAKIAPEVDPATGKSAVPNLDIDELQSMIRQLIVQRFQMKSHMEDRETDAYRLVAVNPHMKKADPMVRTGCKEGPGPDGKDPRVANPILGRLLYCQNTSMAQLGDQLRTLANGYIYAPVEDATGLQGGFDFTISFSTAGQLRSPTAGSGDSKAADQAGASDPNGGISLFEAIRQQLGVKMEKVRRPEPALVIDHIEDKPTDN